MTVSNAPDNDGSTPAALSERIATIIAEYERRSESGLPVDVVALIAEHAELAPTLETELRRRELLAAARRQALAGDTAQPDVPIASAQPDDASPTLIVNSPAAPLSLRCPSCYARLHLAEGADLSRVHCGSCGGQVDLLSRSAPLGAGEWIAQFELLRRLGGGQFGEVWMARDHELDRTVAIKLPRRKNVELWDIEQFLREARATAQLQHPGIAGVYEVGRDGDSVYIVSEYIEGVNLAEHLQGSAIASHEAAELGAQIAAALHHAHQAGVVHRDLKPSNILIDVQGRPHLVDFGLAKRDSGEVTMTLEGRIVGTPAYMSPEQARGDSHQADQRSDIYSLGVILFEMLTGELPFRGNLGMLITQILNDDPPPLRKFNARTPIDLQTIALKCMEKSPERRYATAADVAEELRRYLDGRPILARPISNGERWGRWMRRNPLPTSLLLAVMLSLVAGTFVSTLFAWQASWRAEESRRHAYIVAANLWERDWHDHRASNVAQRLAEQIPADGQVDLRGWEWFYQWRLCHADVRTLLGHTDSLTDVAYSPGGELLATASHDRSVRLWNAERGQLARRIAGFADTVSAISFSPHGERVAAVDWSGVAHVHNVAGGEVAIHIDARSGRLNAVVWSTDGQRLFVAGRSRQVLVYDARSGKHLQNWDAHAQPIQGLGLSPDGRRLASCSGDRLACVWNADTGERLATCAGHAQGVNSVAFSPDGQLLATCSDDGTVRIWNSAEGQMLHTLTGHTEPVTRIAFSPDGSRVASASRDRTVRCWDWANETCERVIAGHMGVVTSIAFRGKLGQLASGSYDRTAKVWDDNAGREYYQVSAHDSAIAAIAPTVDPSIVATAGWDGTVRTWNVATRKEVAKYAPADALILDISALGDRLAATSDNGKVLILDATQGRLRKEHRIANAMITSAAGTSDHNLLILGDAAGKVRCWNPTTNQVLWTNQVQQEAIADVAVHPSSGAIVAAGSRRILVLSVTEGSTARSIEAHPHNITSAFFSPDGDRLVTTSMDHTAVIWRFPHLIKEATFAGHDNSVMCGAFSLDGRRLATGGADRRVIVWDVSSGQSVRAFQCDAETITALSFPAGNELIAGTSSGAMLIWYAAAR